MRKNYVLGAALIALTLGIVALPAHATPGDGPFNMSIVQMDPNDPEQTGHNEAT